MIEPLFPEYPPPQRKAPPPWKPTRNCTLVLDALASGPRGEDELFRRLTGEISPQAIVRALDMLAKNGRVRDTGRRSEVWRDGGRCWIWELVPEEQRASG